MKKQTAIVIAALAALSVMELERVPGAERGRVPGAGKVMAFHRPEVQTEASQETFALPGDFGSFHITFGDWKASVVAAQLVSHMLKGKLGMEGAKTPGTGTFEVILSSRMQTWKGPEVPALDELDDEGFVIQLLSQNGRPKKLQVASKSNVGMYWALSYFFHNYVGARWVYSGNIGEVVPPGPWHIPRRLKIVHPGPMFEQRAFLVERLHLYKEQNTWGRLVPMLYMNSPGGYHRHQYHHNLFRIFDPKEYAQDHPAYYPFTGGRRRAPAPTSRSGWQPCFTNPDAVKVTLAHAEGLFKGKPWLKSLSLAVNDGRGFCVCKACLALGDPSKANGDTHSGRNYGPQYYHYVRNVAEAMKKRFPGKYVTVLPYMDVIWPPEGEPLPDNVLCVYFGNPSDNPEQLAAWKKAVRHFGVYLWYNSDWVWPGSSSPFDMQSYLRQMHAAGAKLFKTEANGTYGLTGMAFWVVSNLLWDVNADVDALIQDYLTSACGEEAGPHIAAFYASVEEVHQRLYPGKIQQAWAVGERQFEGVTDEDMRGLRGHLDKALGVVQGEANGRRLELMDLAFQNVEYFFRRYWTRRTLSMLRPETVAAAEEVLALARKSRSLVAEHESFMREELDRLEHYAWRGHPNKRKGVVYRINGRYRTSADKALYLMAEPAMKAIHESIEKGLIPREFWARMREKYPDLSDFIAGARAAGLELDALPNLLGNGGFEKPLGPLRQPNKGFFGNWVIYHNRNISSRVELSTKGPRRGATCALIHGATSCTGLHQLTRTRGEHRYLLRGYYRTQGGGRLQVGSVQNSVHLEPAGEWTPFQWFFTGKGRLDQQGSIWIGINARKVPGDADQWCLDDVRLVDLTEALREEE